MSLQGPRYWLLSLVKVDRGRIPTGAKKMGGEPIMGQHIPYYAGLIIQERKSGRRYFLDEFNSEVLLGDYLGYTRMGLLRPSLRGMVAGNEFIMLRNNINLVVVQDIDEFIKTNNLIKKHRDAEAMHKIAASIKTCDFRQDY